MNQKNAETKILQAALMLFMERGFAGTSMSQVAAAAGITKSLIYHHFDNKISLWRAVKLSLVESYAHDLSVSSFTASTLRDFLTKVIHFRFQFYTEKPQIGRLMLWQRLEKEQESLQGVSNKTYSTFTPQIINLQRTQQINPNLDPSMVEYVIMSLAANPIIESADFLSHNDNGSKAQGYVNFLIDGLEKMLAP
jgi:AcrR family transcriptional regulator